MRTQPLTALRLATGLTAGSWFRFLVDIGSQDGIEGNRVAVDIGEDREAPWQTTEAGGACYKR
jgi:hypothetical protein